MILCKLLNKLVADVSRKEYCAFLLFCLMLIYWICNCFALIVVGYAYNHILLYKPLECFVWIILHNPALPYYLHGERKVRKYIFKSIKYLLTLFRPFEAIAREFLDDFEF